MYSIPRNMCWTTWNAVMEARSLWRRPHASSCNQHHDQHARKSGNLCLALHQLTTQPMHQLQSKKRGWKASISMMFGKHGMARSNLETHIWQEIIKSFESWNQHLNIIICIRIYAGCSLPRSHTINGMKMPRSSPNDVDVSSTQLSGHRQTWNYRRIKKIWNAKRLARP